MNMPLDFDRAYNDYFWQLYSYGIERCDDIQAVEDMVADCYIKLLRNMDHVQDNPQVISWYLMISMKRKVLDYKRMLKRVDPIEWYDDLPARDDVRRDERGQLLLEAMHILTKRQTQVIALRLGGLQLEEIADMLGITLSCVMSTQRTAFVRLREYFKVRLTDAEKLLYRINQPKKGK